MENHVAAPSGAPSSTMNITPPEENRGSNTGASDPSSGGAESGACVYGQTKSNGVVFSV